MRIAIFETEHFEVAYPLIRLFDLPGNRVTLFTNKNCYQQLIQMLPGGEDRIQFTVQENESTRAFIYHAHKLIKEQQTDLLLLSTVSSNFFFYYLMARELAPLRIILTLHDINTFFYHRYKPSFRRLVRIIGKQLLIKQVSEFNVISTPMVDVLRKKIAAQKKVYCLPGAIFERGHYREKVEMNDVLQIVIPGSIDTKRRDYDLVFLVMEKMKNKNLPVHVTLLGAAHGGDGKAIIARAHSMMEAGRPVSFYDDAVVEQSEYDAQLDNAHLIFIPSVIATVMTDDIKEIYGTTKSSGTVFDAVKHARPIIIPTELAIDSYLEPAAFRYETAEDILAFIEHCVEDRSYLKSLHMKALAASENYTVEKARFRNPGLFFS